MEYKTVKSNSSPDSVQLLQGKKLINLDITSITETDDEGNETTTYSYTQVVVETTDDTDEMTAKYRAEVAQDYLDSTDYIDHKLVLSVYVNSEYTAEEFIAKYSDIYTAREDARTAISDYEDNY